MKHQITRILSVSLSIFLTFLSYPIVSTADSVTSQNINQELAKGYISSEENKEENENIYILQEDTTKRSEFEKHYLCSDGTYVVATYAEAIHYKNDSGIWVDVDNRFMQTPNGDYVSSNGDFGLCVPESAEEGHLMRMSKGNHSISWTLSADKNTQKRSANSANNAQAQKTVSSPKVHVNTTKKPEIIISSEENSQKEYNSPHDEAVFDLPNIAGKVRYDNLFGVDEGISVVYTTYHNKIEEDIYIEKPTDITSFSMEVEVSDLTPKLNADNSVDFVDRDGKMCYHVGIPYMMDANFVVLNDIETTVTRSNSVWIITYTPDIVWFTAEERAYPILLDPSITTNDYVSNIEDTYVEENSTTIHTNEQYLYFTANDTNQRNAIVRINKLPVIDESMPIISAKLTLSAQYAPFSNILLKASYCNSVLDIDEYDYSLTTENVFTYTAHAYLNEKSTTVTFDFSPHIFEMYADEQLSTEYGSDYHGDFIIGYANSGDTTYSYPLISSECTNTASRPVFTVKYGYTLPAGILDGEVYSFQNCGSYSYMTVNGPEPGNNSNVYQVSNDDDIATTTQKFKLEYVSSTGGYLLRSMSSSSGSNKVLDIQRAGGEIYSGRNVQIYSATDPISQEWLIVPIAYDVFRIVPRANMALALTAYGYDNGTNSGKSSTSPGNIFVQTIADNNIFQQWFIYDDDDNEISTQRFRSVLETGNYYLSNKNNGKYLHRSNNVSNCTRGTISALGDETVKWKIVNLGDGYCTIQRSDRSHYYLAPSSTACGSEVRLYNSTSETIPDIYKWSIRVASGGGCLIQNKESGYYLYASNSSVNPSSICLQPLYSEGSDDYQRQTWRVAKEDEYIELNKNTTFSNIALDVDESKSASINKTPNDAYWSSYADFDYTIDSGSQYVTYNSSTKKFTGVTPGIATITATHKVTGISESFTITVNYISVVIPCTFARAASYEEINSYDISINAYISQYSSHLSNVTWYAYGNGAAEFDLDNMTVKGLSYGFAWLEARRNDNIILICFVYVDNILRQFEPDVQDYLYIRGTMIGEISCMEWESNPGLDPYILRTEWYLYVTEMLEEEKSDEEIRTGLIEKYGLEIAEGYSFEVFISQIELGQRGRYNRDNLVMSFDGLRCLFDFYWFQYAAYAIATMDMVNIYTIATPADVVSEQNAARKMCDDARGVIQSAQNAQIAGGYQKDNFQPIILHEGDLVYGLRDGQTSWYTNEKSLELSGMDQVKINEGLQIKPNPDLGYRTKVGVYVVKEDVSVVGGYALNNVYDASGNYIGAGGYYQYYVPNYETILELIEVINLQNLTNP